VHGEFQIKQQSVSEADRAKVTAIQNICNCLNAKDFPGGFHR
jgi:hypothetical protein